MLAKCWPDSLRVLCNGESKASNSETSQEPAELPHPTELGDKLAPGRRRGRSGEPSGHWQSESVPRRLEHKFESGRCGAGPSRRRGTPAAAGLGVHFKFAGRFAGGGAERGSPRIICQPEFEGTRIAPHSSRHGYCSMTEGHVILELVLKSE